MLVGSEAYVANVGDSRAIAVLNDGNGKLNTILLSVDQTPYRKDELLRVQKAGAQILTLEEKEHGLQKSITEWSSVDEGSCDPPRLWAYNKDYPGVCFTRSIGDYEAGIYNYF